MSHCYNGTGGENGREITNGTERIIEEQNTGNGETTEDDIESSSNYTKGVLR